jgi:hypothetical protein
MLYCTPCRASNPPKRLLTSHTSSNAMPYPSLPVCSP